MKYIGIGDNVVDRYITNNIMFPGGNAVNFAVYVSELGKDSAYMGVLADDKEGRLIKNSLVEKGVDISPCTTEHDAGTERCDVELRDGDRVFVGCNTGGGEHRSLRLSEKRLNILKNYDLIHCGCYADMEDEIVKLKDHRAIITFDFSEEYEYRKDEYLAKICPYVDLALFSVADNTDEHIEMLKNKCMAFGVSMILLTKGGDGQVLYIKDVDSDNSKSGEHRYEGHIKRVVPVDTMGAGDSFFAAFVVNLIDGGWAKYGLPAEDAVMKSLRAAADFSAKNCLREGAFGFGTKY